MEVFVWGIDMLGVHIDSDHFLLVDWSVGRRHRLAASDHKRGEVIGYDLLADLWAPSW